MPRAKTSADLRITTIQPTNNVQNRGNQSEHHQSLRLICYSGMVGDFATLGEGIDGTKAWECEIRTFSSMFRHRGGRDRGAIADETTTGSQSLRTLASTAGIPAPERRRVPVQ